MLFSRYKVAYEKKRKIMRNVASVAELKKSFFAGIDKVEARKDLGMLRMGIGQLALEGSGSDPPQYVRTFHSTVKRTYCPRSRLRTIARGSVSGGPGEINESPE
jgi:hypothetical protein